MKKALVNFSHLHLFEILAFDATVPLSSPRTVQAVIVQLYVYTRRNVFC